MPLANAINEALSSQENIRRLFEEGAMLKKQYGAANVFDFSIGNPDVPPPPDFYRVLAEIAAENKDGIHGYMPNAGFADVRAILAKRISEEQRITVDASCVAMCCGAAGGLNVLFKSILNPHDEIIVSRPYFMEYRPYAANYSGSIIEADSLPDFGLDVNAIAAKLSPKTAAVIVNSPHNPTGRIYPKEALAALSQALSEHGKKCGRYPYLIFDEPYREITYDGIETPPVLNLYPQSVVVNSYSKSLSLPGERIGYIALSPLMDCKDELMDAIIYCTRVLGFMNAPAIMQRAIAGLVHAKVDVSIYERRRNLFTAILDDCGISYARPDGAFYLFCKVPGRVSSGETSDTAFCDHLNKHRILSVPGSLFAFPGWLRFAYCVDETIIKASAAAFKSALQEWNM